MIYQLRSYLIPQGRMPDILARFQDTTMRLFGRHGIEVVGFWTVDDPDPGRELVYITRFASLEASRKAWDCFRADPEWVETRTRTEASGPIVESVTEKTMTATSFSPLQ